MLMTPVLMTPMPMTPVPMTPSVLEVRRQLDRILESRVLASRPRSAEMLRYFVEQSIRNGFTPISQRQIATHGLGFDEAFSPGRSAEVRVKVGRLRDALDRYYRGPGRDDRVVFTISQGPYRLVATSNGVAHAKQVRNDARLARRARPTLLVVEPEVRGQPGDDGLGLGVGLRIVSLLVEDLLVTASGPLRRDRIVATAAESTVCLADQLGYDFVVETEIRIEDVRWRVRAIITDTKSSEPAADVTHAFEPQANGAPADDVATWIYHRIGATFITRS